MASSVTKSAEIPSGVVVIKPVSKHGPKNSSTEAVILQTTSAQKKPITITKYVPPDKKPPMSLTKVTISMSSEDKDKPNETKETKPGKETEKEAKLKDTAKETKLKEIKEAKTKDTKEAKFKETKEFRGKESKEPKLKEAKDPKLKESTIKTIKTLMPMRPPNTTESKETPDVAKPKDVK